jgi:hypothetical protein
VSATAMVKWTTASSLKKFDAAGRLDTVAKKLGQLK